MTRPLPSPLLAIEASSSAGSIALVVDGTVVAERSVVMGVSRDDALLPAIADVLSDVQLQPSDIRAVACGSGPGSFTSLRIAASLAKGIVVANDAVLFAIPSLLLAAAVLSAQPGRYILHADALRGERYAARVAVTVNGDPQMSSVARMTLENVVAIAARENRVVIAIDGTASTVHDTLVLQPHARNVVLLDAMWSEFGPVAVESWEPAYGRLAEAQVKWESVHARPLPVD